MINKFVRCTEVPEPEGPIKKVGRSLIARYTATEVGDLCEVVEVGKTFSAYRASVVNGVVNEDDILLVSSS